MFDTALLQKLRLPQQQIVELLALSPEIQEGFSAINVQVVVDHRVDRS